MKPFIIFFKGQEGSSAIISYLQKLKQTNILGFEPFDTHHMKAKLVGEDLKRIFKLIFDKNIKFNYNQNIKQIYKKYTDIQINNIDKKKAIGFKMRPRELNNIMDVIKKNDVTVFVLIRHDICRHAISMCSTNRLQFDLKAGKIQKNPKHKIDLSILNKNIEICKNVLKQKQYLINMLKKHNINVYPIYYEEFCKNKAKFFNNMLRKLDIKLSQEELQKFASCTIPFKKVHDERIKKFVINYDEVVAFLKKKGLSL